MRIYLCADTAEEFWHSARLTKTPLLDELEALPRNSERLGMRPARVRSLEEEPPDDAVLRGLLKSALHGMGRPVHVLVSCADRRRWNDIVRCHVWTAPVPPGAFVRIGTRLFVATPEFVFLQKSLRLSRIELVRYGYGLCGGYAIAPAGFEDSSRCLPLTTVDMLRRFLSKVEGGTHGLRSSLWAARHIAGRSGSPMESVMVMLLTLPRTIGGYGLPLPSMNERVDVPPEARHLVGRPWVACDARWPSGLALEYDGKEHHRGRANVVRDYGRANDLAALGIPVRTCAIEMMRDWEEFDRLARQVARDIGVRLRGRDLGEGWRDANRKLRRLLIPDCGDCETDAFGCGGS